MSILYERIAQLCRERGISGGRMCGDLGISRSMLTDLKMGRKKTVGTDTAAKIASYLGVSVDYLTGNSDEKKLLVNNDEELTEYLEALKNRSEMRMLFNLAKNASKEDVERAVKIIEALRK